MSHTTVAAARTLLSRRRTNIPVCQYWPQGSRKRPRYRDWSALFFKPLLSRFSRMRSVSRLVNGTYSARVKVWRVNQVLGLARGRASRQLEGTRWCRGGGRTECFFWARRSRNSCRPSDLDTGDLWVARRRSYLRALYTGVLRNYETFRFARVNAFQNATNLTNASNRARSVEP